jgi:hypothetical protein
MGDFNKITVNLQIIVADANGIVKQSMSLPNDPFTDNFRSLFSGVFTEHNGAEVTTNLTSFYSTPMYISVKTPMEAYTGGGSSDAYSFSCPVNSATGGKIGIGNGTSPANVADYNLENQIGSWTSVSSPIYTNGQIIFSSAIGISNDVNISESGVALLVFAGNVYVGSEPALVLHDTFTALPATNGDTVTVTYTIQLLNTGFTDNFGQIIAGIFRYKTPGTDWYITLTDISGTSKNAYLGRSHSGYWLFSTHSGAANNTGIEVGIGNGALNRSSYNLTTSINTLMSNSNPVYSSSGINGTITFSTTLVFSANYNLTEAGFFMKGVDTSDGTFTYMLWRSIFVEYEYSSDDPLTVTYVVSG